MDKVLEIINEIKKFDTVIIHRHVRPDPDAYGSQGGLAEILKASFTDKQIYIVGKEEESLHFMNRLDVITDETYTNALVIVCDTANQERICDNRYSLGAKLIKIDHHPNEDPYGDILWVDTSASSVSEMIYGFYLTGMQHGLKITQEAARLLYAGIVGDTGRFMFRNTTTTTFRYASELVSHDISITDIYDSMYQTKIHTAHLQGHILQTFEMSKNGVGSVILKKELLDQYGVTVSESSQFVGILGSIEGIKVWVFFVEEDDQIRVRLRSKGVVINTIAMKYNGGGHPLASGATIYNWEDVKKVLADLELACVEGN